MLRIAIVLTVVFSLIVTPMAFTKAQYTEILLINTKFPARDLSWDATSRKLAIVGAELLQIWNVDEERMLQNIESDFISTASSVSWHPDGKKVATLGNRMIVWDIATGKDLNVLSFPDNETNSGVVTWNPLSSILAFSHWDNDTSKIRARIWNESTQHFTDIGTPTSSENNWLAWSPDGTRLAISDYHSAKIWEAKTGKLLFALEQADYITQLAWSPDGQMIAGSNGCLESCATQKTFQIWSAIDGHLLTSVEVHTSDVLSVSWSPDSNMIASGSKDKTINIWSFKTKKTLLTIFDHMDQINRVSWSSDGTKIASASDDNTVRIWDVHLLASAF